MKAGIKWIEYSFPKDIVTNESLAEIATGWSAEKIKIKTGIAQRYRASAECCASDLAFAAAKQLFAQNVCLPSDIDFVIFCTQSPDYLLPTSACILQDRLGLSTSCGALDINLGCSGYVYALGMAKGLVETNQAQNVLVLTADTYTKYLPEKDISTRSIFSDAGTATLVTGVANENSCNYMSVPVYGTDGSGAENLMVKFGGARYRNADDLNGCSLYMNGPDIFVFTLKAVPKLVNQVLEREKKSLNDIDLFVFHQANKYMLEHLREKIAIDKDKFFLALEDVGNTVSSSIPIALRRAYDVGEFATNKQVMLVGFGVGYSWAGMVVTPFI